MSSTSKTDLELARGASTMFTQLGSASIGFAAFSGLILEIVRRNYPGSSLVPYAVGGSVALVAGTAGLATGWWYGRKARILADALAAEAAVLEDAAV